MLQDVRRLHTFKNQILYVDGISGSGKFAVGSLVQSLERVETIRVEYILDHVCGLNKFGHITDEAAQALIRFYSDLRIHDGLISRDVNFRPSDLTSVLSGLKKSEYINRLHNKDGDIVSEKISSERPILHFMGHQIFCNSSAIFSALESRLLFIEVIRHPLSLLHHWFSYISKYGVDPRNFTLWINHRGVNLPWFARGIEEEYFLASNMDKCIYSIENLFRLRKNRISSMSQEELDRYLEIPFEHYVLNPNLYIDKICTILSTKRMTGFDQVMRDQKLPRKVTSDSPNSIWTEKYGEIRPEIGSNDQIEHERCRAFAKEHASTSALKRLDLISYEYACQHLA
jgi:hypothetical protein